MTSAYERANAVRTDSGEGRLEVSLTGDLRGHLEETHLYLLCQQTFREVHLTFKIEFI